MFCLSLVFLICNTKVCSRSILPNLLWDWSRWFRPLADPVIKKSLLILLNLVSDITHESGEMYRQIKEKKNSAYMNTCFGNEQ